MATTNIVEACKNVRIGSGINSKTTASDVEKQAAIKSNIVKIRESKYKICDMTIPICINTNNESPH